MTTDSPETRERLRKELATWPLNGSFSNGSLADYFEGIQTALENAGILTALTPTPAPNDSGLVEAAKQLADVVERLTDAIERQEQDIGGESVKAVLPDLGPAYDKLRAQLSAAPSSQEVERLRTALHQIAGGTEDVAPPFRSLGLTEIRRIARQALSPPSQEEQS